MDCQKVTHVLREIFQLYGPEVLQDRSRFESCLEDLLPGNTYATERLVLRHAMETPALWPLTKTPAITTEMAERAVEQLQNEGRMLKEDAQFVVQCIAVARGGRAVISAKPESGKSEEPPNSSQPKEPRPQEVKTEPLTMDQPLETVPCGIFGYGRGILHLYQDKLRFISDKTSFILVEMPYSEIRKMRTRKAARWIFPLLWTYLLYGVIRFMYGRVQGFYNYPSFPAFSETLLEYTFEALKYFFWIMISGPVYDLTKTTDRSIRRYVLPVCAIAFILSLWYYNHNTLLRGSTRKRKFSLRFRKIGEKERAEAIIEKGMKDSLIQKITSEFQI